MILTRHLPRQRSWALCAVSAPRLHSVSLGNGTPQYLEIELGKKGEDTYRVRCDARDMTKLRAWLRPLNEGENH